MFHLPIGLFSAINKLHKPCSIKQGIKPSRSLYHSAMSKTKKPEIIVPSQPLCKLEIILGASNRHCSLRPFIPFFKV